MVGRYEQGHGTQWSDDQIVGWVTAELESRSVSRIAVDSYGENGPLIPLLEAAGFEVVKLNTQDMRNACMGVHSAVLNGQLHHLNDAPLNIAVAGARRRKSGEGWLWSRTHSVTDIGPLMAVAAAWWVYVSGDAEYDVMDSFF
jgi:phage terminase large subunit-like protein